MDTLPFSLNESILPDCLENGTKHRHSRAKFRQVLCFGRDTVCVTRPRESMLHIPSPLDLWSLLALVTGAAWRNTKPPLKCNDMPKSATLAHQIYYKNHCNSRGSNWLQDINTSHHVTSHLPRKPLPARTALRFPSGAASVSFACPKNWKKNKEDIMQIPGKSRIKVHHKRLCLNVSRK